MIGCLPGCPSLTDSEVNRKEAPEDIIDIYIFRKDWMLWIVARGGGEKTHERHDRKKCFRGGGLGRSWERVTSK